MSGETFRIEPFDPQSASDALWDQFFEFERAIFKETSPDPDDEPISRKIMKRFMVDPDPFHEQVYWMVKHESGELIGFCQADFVTKEAPNYEENKHIVRCSLRVAKDSRRQGLGTRLLKTLLEKAISKKATTLQAGTTHDAGHAFCKHLDGIEAIQGAENRLKLAEVDWGMIEAWQEAGPKRAAEVTIEDFEAVPEANIEAYTGMYTELMNQQPMGELENQMKTTPESRRVQEAEMQKKGIRWFTKVTKEADGTISGLTEILYSEEEPTKAFQLLTGVKEQFRGRGLGKWLKADMLLYVRKRYPNVKFIITGNADSNVPMLSINDRMGFKKHLGDTAYKFKVQALCSKLEVNS